MAIPDFTIDGVLPPYVGARGPGDERSLMSPFEVTPLEVVTRFGTTSARMQILEGWLEHRARIRNCGFVSGFQWLDGSFVEDKIPADIDVVTFLRRPAKVNGPDAVVRLMRANPNVFSRQQVKAELRVDSFWVDMDGTKPMVVDLTRYFCGLFSHRRGDGLWKGMLKVSIDADSEREASVWLQANQMILAPQGTA